MTIKELENRTGLSRANIRFYEKEGLLTPLRRENGYREYTEQDADTLLRIKLLRSLQLPIEEIRIVQSGEKRLSDVMGTHLQVLTLNQEAIEQAGKICRLIQKDQTEFSKINAAYYLKKLNEVPQYNWKVPQQDKQLLPANPWRRLLARTFDQTVYMILWNLLLLWIWGVSPQTKVGQMIQLAAFVLGLLTMVLIEPLWIRRFKVTPGKLLLGLRFSEAMPYRIGLRRTWDLVRYGCLVPVYRLVGLWRAYWSVSYGEPARWDEGMAYVEAKQPWKRSRAAVVAAGYAVLVMLLWIGLTALRLPPNRGDLTIAEFAENYNHFYRYYGGTDQGFYLDENGQWCSKAQGAVMHIDGVPDPLKFELRGNTVVAVSFERSAESPMLVTNERAAELSLALIGAQPGAGLLSGALDRVINASNHGLSFSVTECGVSVGYYQNERSAESRFYMKIIE